MPIPVPGRIAEQLRHSTVQVRAMKEAGSRFQLGQGSAVVLAGGLVVTNAHVVHSARLLLETWEGKTLEASVDTLDRRQDLAALRAPGLDVTPATLGDSTLLRAGTPVVAVGNPFGFVGAVSTGVVHAVGPLNHPRPGRDWIQADVQLAPGNSGGPLATFQGEVVGINTMIVGGGLAMAVPSRAVQDFLSRKPAMRPTLGFVLRPVRLTDRSFGLIVLQLAPGGPAERASLLLGDILVAVDDQRLTSVEELELHLERATGATLSLSFYRGGQPNLRKVTLQLARPRVMSAA